MSKKDKEKDKDKAKAKADRRAEAAARLETEQTPKVHVGAAAEAAALHEPLPSGRAALLALHQELRHRRDVLPLLSEERATVVIELARVEVEVARVERAMDPPLV